MPGRRATAAQRSALALAVFFTLTGIIGLIVNPDFGTGANTSAEQFLIDWNGWHAVLTLLLAGTAFAAATKPTWALVFHAFNAFGNATTAVWALFDSTPLGILDLPNVATDVMLHLVVTCISLIVLLLQLRRDRTAGPLATAV